MLAAHPHRRGLVLGALGAGGGGTVICGESTGWATWRAVRTVEPILR